MTCSDDLGMTQIARGGVHMSHWKAENEGLLQDPISLKSVGYIEKYRPLIVILTPRPTGSLQIMVAFQVSPRNLV